MKKAIKITEGNKVNFPNKEVGKIYALNVPKTFIIDGDVVFSYDKREDLQALDGWKEFVVPTLSENQYRGSTIIENGNVYTYEVFEKIPLTEQELYEQELEQETQLYLQREQDGKNAYAKLSAEFRLAKKKGILSEQEQKAIERKLIPVRNEVLAGQWISGLQFLEEINPLEIGQGLYDRLHKMISEYINKGY